MSGLTNGTTYLFEVRAVNDLHEGEWSDTAQTTVGASWELTLIDANANPLTELTEGGADFTARLRITNSVTFAAQETITIQLLAHTHTGTIGAGETTIDVAVPIPDDDLHRPGGPFEITVFALHGANSLASKTINVVDDEDPPVLTLTLDKDRIVEGESVIATAMLTHGYTTPVTADIADATGDIAKIATSSIDHTNPVLTLSFIAGTTASVPGTIDTVDGSTPGDHGELVLTVRGDNALFRPGPVRTFTVTILDDDTAPSAPRSLRATGGNGQVRLTWQRPASYDTTTLTGYELKVTPAVGDFTSFADIPGGDAETTSYTVTGLTNDTTYTFEVRAENDAGASTAASATATPRNEGVFIDPTTITEGGETTITLLPKGTPFASTKIVTVVLAGADVLDGTGEVTDFSLANGDAVLSATNLPLPAPGRAGTYPHYDIAFAAGETELALTLEATEDTVAECREDLFVYAYTDYGRSTEQRITQRPLTSAHNVFIEDDDAQAKIESAVIDSRTVTLTFDQAITLVRPPQPGDADYDEEDGIPHTPEQYFSLFTGASPSANDSGTYAHSFSLAGSTVTLTYAEAIGENVSAWVRYSRWGRYAPLGAPPGGECGEAVGTGTWELTNETTGGIRPLPALTIADAEGRERIDTHIAFTVTLTPASSELVTVDYRTIARTATEGLAPGEGDYTRTRGTLEFTPGETSKTVRVPITDDTVEDGDETFLLDIYEASGATMVDTESWATGTIRNREDAPTGNENELTARFSAVPAEHGGPGEANRFSFALAFSENPEVSYATLRDHAFTVTGGAVKQARRTTQGSNQHWTITVEPLGWGNVVMTLPGHRACTATGAVCTADNRRLTNSPSATVSGPGALSVADASARENADAALNFVVSLDRPSTLTVTVEYATSDGTATAGADYTATSGTLTFAPDDVAKAVSVPVLDDAVDEGTETMTLTLSNATNARIADATATGTIENSDPLQKAWIARFGRTVASEVVEGITDRLATHDAPSEVRIAGIALGRNGAAWTERALDDEDERAGTDDDDRTMTGREALMQSSFRLQSERDDAGAPAWTAWGRFSAASFEGETDGVELSGDVTTGLVGADVGTDEWTAGIALSSARGDGPFALTGERASSRAGGTVESSLTSVHPYAQAQLSERVALWAVGGYGAGTMTIAEDGATPMETGIDMTMAAFGVRGDVLDTSAGDALDLELRSDALWLRATSDATPEMVGARAEVTRLRLVLDASRGFDAGAGATLTPSIEAGVRRDAGDAEEGIGFDVGAGLRYQAGGISIEGAVRALLAHEDTDYREWGASGAIRIDPGADGRGLSLSVAPAWGNAASGAERMWSARDAAGLVRDEDFEAESRIEAELGYGLRAPRGLGTVTPYTGLTLSGTGAPTWRGGARWKVSERTSIALEGTREPGAGDAGAEHALTLRASVRF